jgi:shikimate dehydrogenase
MDGLLGVVDIVYNPIRTGLCLAAEKIGKPSESGLRMLVAQAVFSSELFQDTKLDDALIEKIFSKLSQSSQNIVLIGMPGCGKTTTGRRLARMLERPFVDIDEAIKARTGRACADIIREDGEGAFRAIETEVTGSYGAHSGLVVACGGGVVTRAENYDLIHQNGTIVMIDRPIEELSLKGRPISQDKGLGRIARERMGTYRSWADLVVASAGSPQANAKEIAHALNIGR